MSLCLPVFLFIYISCLLSIFMSCLSVYLHILFIFVYINVSSICLFQFNSLSTCLESIFTCLSLSCLSVHSILVCFYLYLCPPLPRSLLRIFDLFLHLTPCFLYSIRIFRSYQSTHRYSYISIYLSHQGIDREVWGGGLNFTPYIFFIVFQIGGGKIIICFKLLI